MSWTVERLDALPEGTVLVWDQIEPAGCFTKESGGAPDRPWAYSRGGRESSRSLALEIGQHEGFRVVSVPVDVLLSDETVWTSARHPQLLGKSVSIARDVLTRAVARITGEGST